MRSDPFKVVGWLVGRLVDPSFQGLSAEAKRAFIKTSRCTILRVEVPMVSVTNILVACEGRAVY